MAKKWNPRRQQSPKLLRIWRHNGFFGSVSMMVQNLRAMHQSDTLSAEARTIVNRMLADASLLAEALKQRQDPPST